jgi:hypothetical protein
MLTPELDQLEAAAKAAFMKPSAVTTDLLDHGERFLGSGKTAQEYIADLRKNRPHLFSGAETEDDDEVNTLADEAWTTDGRPANLTMQGRFLTHYGTDAARAAAAKRGGTLGSIRVSAPKGDRGDASNPSSVAGWNLTKQGR